MRYQLLNLSPNDIPSICNIEEERKRTRTTRSEEKNEPQKTPWFLNEVEGIVGQPPHILSYLAPFFLLLPTTDNGVIN
jgi:hypothetical protein